MIRLTEEFTPEEEEIYRIDECKVFARKDGSMILKCGGNVQNIKIGDMELRFIQGISELVRSLKSSEEKTQQK